MLHYYATGVLYEIRSTLIELTPFLEMQQNASDKGV